MFERENKFNNNLESDNCLLNTMKPNISQHRFYKVIAHILRLKS